MRAGHGVALEQQAQFDLQRGVGMVGGQPLDLSGADEVGPRIADVGDGDLVVAEDRSQQGRGHAPFLRGLKDLGGRGVEHLADQVRGGRLGLGLPEDGQGGFHRQAAGHVAVVFAADAVGQQGDAAELLAAVEILRLPEEQKILVVVADRAGAGKLVAFDFHVLAGKLKHNPPEMTTNPATSSEGRVQLYALSFRLAQ